MDNFLNTILQKIVLLAVADSERTTQTQTIKITMMTMTLTTMTITMTMKAWYALGRGRPDCEEGEGTLSSAITLAIAVTLYCRDLHDKEYGIEMPW